MEYYNFGPELMTLERFMKSVGQPKTKVVIDVFELNKLEPDQARKVRRDHKLDEERPEDIYQVNKHVETIQWKSPRSIPGLLFESGLDLAQPYVVTFGYAKDVVTCIPRVVEDKEEIPVIEHIHWSEEALRKIGMWQASTKSIWRVKKVCCATPLRKPPVARELKQKETIDFSKYTNGARQAMGLSRSAAFDYKSSHINSGLLLVGLAREGNGVAANILKEMLNAENIETVKTKIEESYKRVTPRGKAVLPVGSKIPFSSRGLEALQLAELEAKALNQNYIGTEHLLLGIAMQEVGNIYHMFINLGLSGRSVRLEVFNILGLKDPTT